MTTEVLTPEQSAALAKVATVAVDLVRLAAFGADWQESLVAFREAAATADPLNPDVLMFVDARLRDVQVALKNLEDDRVVLTKPLVEDQRLINGGYRTSRAPAEALEAELKAFIGRAVQATRDAEAAALALAATSAATGDDEGCQAALASLPTQVKTGSSTSFKWAWTVTDAAVMDRRLLQPNEKALNALCKAHDASGTPPAEAGVVFNKVPHVRGGRKT